MANQTCLFAEHLANNATMVEFAGWDMPLHYGSQLQEHLQVRRDAGIFDVSHMAVVDIKGDAAKAYLSNLLANDVGKLKVPGKALYSCMLNSQGGVLDDLITYAISPNFYRIVINAATTEKDLAWLQQQRDKFLAQEGRAGQEESVGKKGLEIVHRPDLAILAVQGPNAKDKVKQIVASEIAEKINNLKKFNNILVAEQLFATTGYTGEDGLEIILPAAQAQNLWHDLLNNGVKPIGLGARDSLRLEAGFNLYGNDMDETVTPLESNLAWTVALNNHDFIGSKALLAQQQQGVKQKLIGITLDKGMLRHGQKLYTSGKECGIITSGGFSPILKKSIGFARVAMPVEKNYAVAIRSKLHDIDVVQLPFI